MLSGRGKKEYAKEAQTIAEAGPDGLPAEQANTNGEGEVTEEALVALEHSGWVTAPSVR